MQFTRNHFLFIFVFIVLLLKLVFAEVYFKKSIYPKNGGELSTYRISTLKKDLMLAQFKLIEKTIEADLLKRRLQELVGEDAVKKAEQTQKMESVLSDEARKLLREELNSEKMALTEEGLRRFLKFLRENEALFRQSEDVVSKLISSDGMLPFLNTIDQQRDPNIPLFLRGGVSRGEAVVAIMGSEEIPVVEFRGPDRLMAGSSFFMNLIKGVVQVLFDLLRVVVTNKELFLILMIFFGLFIGGMVIYSMHFR